MATPHPHLEAPLAIVAPLQEEIAPFLARIQRRQSIEIGGRRFVRGTIGGRTVLAGTTGDGRRRAAHTIEQLLDREPTRGLVVLGVAGALTADLAVGSILVADEVLAEGCVLPRPDAALLARLPMRPYAVLGAVVTTEHLVAGPAARRRIQERWGRTPASVDLESGIFAAAAGERGVPYLALRAISDAAHESLPQFLLRSTDAEGSVRRGRLVGRALFPPTRMLTLWQLARRVRFCAGRLADLAEGLFQASTPGGGA